MPKPTSRVRAGVLSLSESRWRQRAPSRQARLGACTCCTPSLRRSSRAGIASGKSVKSEALVLAADVFPEGFSTRDRDGVDTRRLTHTTEPANPCNSRITCARHAQARRGSDSACKTRN
eukprot:3938910-Rhodomonas_salina.4